MPLRPRFPPLTQRSKLGRELGEEDRERGWRSRGGRSGGRRGPERVTRALPLGTEDVLNGALRGGGQAGSGGGRLALPGSVPSRLLRQHRHHGLSTLRPARGHGRLLRPRASRLLSGAGQRCGGQEAGRPAGSGAQSLLSRQPSPPVPGAPLPIPAALARATRNPDEPRWLGHSPECTPCNSSQCACPTASRRAPNSSSGMM